jgi:hypothetical protein
MRQDVFQAVKPTNLFTVMCAFLLGFIFPPTALDKFVLGKILEGKGKKNYLQRS